jgi:hypothetical protein
VDYFQRMQDYPFAADLLVEPRFQQVLRRIQSANGKMREALQKTAGSR